MPSRTKAASKARTPADTGARRRNVPVKTYSIYTSASQRHPLANTLLEGWKSKRIAVAQDENEGASGSREQDVQTHGETGSSRQGDGEGETEQTVSSSHPEIPEDADDDRWDALARDAYADRSKKGWSTRRARIDALARSSDSSPEPSPLLPDDDLLHAIHRHTSDFYTEHRLLLEPKKQVRSRPWGSAKRQLIDSEHSTPAPRTSDDRMTEPDRDRPSLRVAALKNALEATNRSSRTLRPNRRSSNYSRGPGSVEREGSDSDDSSGNSADAYREERDLESEESDTGRTSGSRRTKRGSKIDGNTRDAVDDSEADTPPSRIRTTKGSNTPASEAVAEGANAKVDGRTVGKKGRRYKLRDMYKALDGSALLALGILVEEHIKAELFRAGYSEPEPGAHHTATADGNDTAEAGDRTDSPSTTGGSSPVAKKRKRRRE